MNVHCWPGTGAFRWLRMGHQLRRFWPGSALVLGMGAMTWWPERRIKSPPWHAVSGASRPEWQIVFAPYWQLHLISDNQIFYLDKILDFYLPKGTIRDLNQGGWVDSPASPPDPARQGFSFRRLSRLSPAPAAKATWGMVPARRRRVSVGLSTAARRLRPVATGAKPSSELFP